MRGCPTPSANRADALAKQTMTSCHIRCGSSACGSVPAAGVTPSLAQSLCHQQHHGAHIGPGRSFPFPLRRANPSAAAAAAPDSSMNPEEEEAYIAFMQQRKAERKAWKLEVRRRAKFNPMASPGPGPATTAGAAGTAPAAPPLPALTRPRAPSAAAPSAPPSRLPEPAGAVAGTRIVDLAASRQAVATKAAAAAKVKSTKAAADDDDDDDDGAFLADSDMDDNDNDMDDMDNDMGDMDDDEDDNDNDMDDDEDEDGDLDLGGMAAMARKMLEEEDDGDEAAAAIPLISSSSGGGSNRRPAASTAAAARRPGAPAPKRQLMPIAQLQRQRAAAAAATDAEAAVPVAGAKQGQGGKREGVRQQQPQREEEAEDDLDWDALQAYEKYEQYVNDIAKEQERAARAAARRAASASAGTSKSASVPGTAAAGHRSAATTTTSASGAAAKPAAAAAAAVQQPPGGAAVAAGRRKRDDGARAAAAAAVEAPDTADKLSNQLDQWEQMINFFEVVERDSKREAARKRRLQAAAQADEAEGPAGRSAAPAGEGATASQKKTNAAAAAAGAAAAAAVGGLSLAAELDELGLSVGGGGGAYDDEDDVEAQGEVEVDWQSLERMFLGEGWEAELTELRARVEAGDSGKLRGMEDAKASGQGGEGGATEAEEEEVESWRDEVSTLLLGLVEISAKRYLGWSLLALAQQQQQQAAAGGAPAAAVGAPVGEGERAAMFWEAPFLLLVQDDSLDPLLEYANRAALSALRLGGFDEATAGLPLATLVDPADPRSQQEWMWACAEAAERAEGHATLPSLRLRGPGPGAPALLAAGVTVFRVDSLEGEAVGQAVLARNWRLLTEEEAAGRRGTEEEVRP